MATKSIVQNDVMSNSSHFKGTSLAYWLRQLIPQSDWLQEQRLDFRSPAAATISVWPQLNTCSASYSLSHIICCRCYLILKKHQNIEAGHSNSSSVEISKSSIFISAPRTIISDSKKALAWSSEYGKEFWYRKNKQTRVWFPTFSFICLLCNFSFFFNMFLALLLLVLFILKFYMLYYMGRKSDNFRNGRIYVVAT